MTSVADTTRRVRSRLGVHLVAAFLCVVHAGPASADWEDHERLTREQLVARLDLAAPGAKPDLKAKNLTGLDLHGIDFRGADLSSTVFNAANLRGANLDDTNLTVAFFEHADLSGASLRHAELFSGQLAGAILRNADLDGVRFIGDLRNADFSGARMTHMKGAADMKNQSMGLMHTSMVNGRAVGADLSDSDFSRAEFTFSDFSHARMVRTRLYRADFSGSTLTDVDLSGADLQDARLTNADLTNANLTNADLSGADLQGVTGLDTAIKTGARGLSTMTPAAEPSRDAPAAAPKLELVVLGSGGPGATGRAASSYLVLLQGIPRILVDAGPGSFARLGESRLSLSDTDLVLLTHLHVDHAGELPGLFKARAVSGGGPLVFDVWGPAGSAPGKDEALFPPTTRFIDLLFGRRGAYAYLRDFAAPITLHAHDVPAAPRRPAAPQIIHKSGDLAISAIAGHHWNAPAVIYRIDYAGHSVTFSGDIDADGLANLRRIAKGSDLLVFNSVVLDPPGSRELLYSLHSPPRAIGELARNAGVHQVLLSHLSPAVDGNRDAVSESIRATFPGPVTFAEDLTHIEIR